MGLFLPENMERIASLVAVMLHEPWSDGKDHGVNEEKEGVQTRTWFRNNKGESAVKFLVLKSLSCRQCL